MDAIRFILQLPFRIPLIGELLVTGLVLLGALVPGLWVSVAINESLGVTGFHQGQESAPLFEIPGVFWGWVAAGLGAALMSVFWEWLVNVEFLDPLLGIPFKYLGLFIAAIASLFGFANLIAGLYS